jgi:hypothetical protein
MAIDIKTVRKYLKAQNISEHDACSDELVLNSDQAPDLFEYLDTYENSKKFSAEAATNVAYLIRSIILKAYGHQADDWKYHELAREREGVFKEMKDNPDPETR